MKIIHDPVRSPHAPETAKYGLLGAYVAGADALRVPVRLTADGKLAVLEDDDVSRLTGTQGSVAKMTWKELRALNFGAKFATAGGNAFTYPSTVDTFPMLLDTLPPDLTIVADLKVPDKQLAHEVAAAAQRRGIDANLVILPATNEQRDEAKKVSSKIRADFTIVNLDQLKTSTQPNVIVAAGDTRLSPDDITLMQSKNVWGVITNSGLDAVHLLRPGWQWIDEKWSQQAANHDDVDANTWHLGYAKYNPEKFCHVYPDDGIHVDIKPYDKPITYVPSGDPIKDALEEVTERTWEALKNWPFYSGGGAGFAPGIRGDFSAEVDIESIKAQQATTVEMAATNVDPAPHRKPWIQDANGNWIANPPLSFRDKHTFFDPHGGPPYVGVEHDEDDGWRINWNLGIDYDSNQYGKSVGDGKQLKGRMRLDRRGTFFAAFYRPDGLDRVSDWICVGAVRNESLNEVVYLRLAGKRWRQEDPANPSKWMDVIPNHFTFRNFTLKRFV